MTVSFKDAGKRFNQDWIFRHLDYTFDSSLKYAIVGGNGSGKSTLLKSILGYSPLSEGSMQCTLNGNDLSHEATYKHFSFCSPYMELYEELNLTELVDFHKKLKPLKAELDTESFIERIELGHAKKKPVKYFSSGMKQRVRLGLAILSNTEALLLDEPISNLDKKAINWYKELVQEEIDGRLVVVESNLTEDEYFFSTEILNVEDFKNR